MNREMLYREISNIDDDLIEAANAAPEHYKRPILSRIAGIAACLCLICVGIFYSLQRDAIYINEMPIPAISKAVVPDGETAEPVFLTYQELLAYYGLAQLPDAFGETLIKAEQSHFALYRDQQGEILYDTNRLYYSSIDGSKTLQIVLTKNAEDPHSFCQDIRLSKIDGITVQLAVSSNDNGYRAYWAALKANDLSVQIVSDGLREAEFIHTVKALVRVLKSSGNIG